VEIVEAGKVRFPRAAALTLVRTGEMVVTGRGAKLVAFDLVHDPPDDDTLAAAILGPSGNLKAPTIRVGDTFLVGFNDQAYRKYLESDASPKRR